MPTSKLLVTAPMLRISRRVTVTGGEGGPWRGGAAESILDPGTLDVVRAAVGLGATVHCVLAVEPSAADAVRAGLEELGATSDLLETGSASLRHTTYVGEDGAPRFEVVEGAPPPPADVDRLLDVVARHVEGSPDFVVVAGDLEGGPRRDFAERVVGRAWGLGIRTVLVPSGPSLKQAFHTQPFAAWVDAGELTTVSPPDEGETETQEESLARIFLDPVRLLLVRRDDGAVFAAAREGTRELGRPAEWNPEAVLGAFSALAPACDEDYLAAAANAFRAASPADATQPAP